MAIWIGLDKNYSLPPQFLSYSSTPCSIDNRRDNSNKIGKNEAELLFTMFSNNMKQSDPGVQADEQMLK